MCKTTKPPFAILVTAAAFAVSAGTTRGAPTKTTPAAPRLMESLDRGVIVIPQGESNCVSWRLLGTEPRDTLFDVFRSDPLTPPARLNADPLDAATFFVDPKPPEGRDLTYTVRPRGTTDAWNAGDFTIPAGRGRTPFLEIPLRTPHGYTPNDGSVGDLDGDGQYEIVLHQVGVAHDNSHAGFTDPPILQAYELDGTMLWQIDLGINIREGAHYTQFIVYDLDGNGTAEVVCKTADGTRDGLGTVIGDHAADWRNEQGYILAGPEYLTVFEGQTGRALSTTDYVPARHPDTAAPTPSQLDAIWGDGYGNRCDRFLACVAYLDGSRPSVVMCRGYYTRTVLAAWDWRDGEFTLRWVFDSNDPGNEAFAGQGNHNLSVADIDRDGRDEIVYGGMAIDDDGTGLYSTGLGHGDAIHLTDLDPARPGLEVFRTQERIDDAGVHMFDAATGEVLWKHATSRGREGPGRGTAFDIDARFPGAECWAAGGGLDNIYDARGELIRPQRRADGGWALPVNMGVWWDGDPLRELLDGERIEKWRPDLDACDTLLDASAYRCASNNGTKATPVLVGDILGDWREEVIWRTEDNQALRVFSSAMPTSIRLPTFMHDPQYRLSIAWQNVGYNQPPHPGFFVGAGMQPPPHARIQLTGGQEHGRHP